MIMAIFFATIIICLFIMFIGLSIGKPKIKKYDIKQINKAIQTNNIRLFELSIFKIRIIGGNDLIVNQLPSLVLECQKYNFVEGIELLKELGIYDDYRTV